MPITTLSSREFNQDRGKAKKATRTGPVFITNRGKPEMVLLSIEEYRQITHTGISLFEAIFPSDGLSIDLELTRFKDKPREVDLT